MIKLVLSDVDNTLIPFGRESVSQRTIDAIHACQEQGVDFGPATGRDRAELASFFGGDKSCYNTAVCVSGQKAYYLGSLVFERCLDDELLRRAARYVQTLPGCAFITYRPDGLGDWVGITREEMGSMYDRAFLAGGVHHDELPVYPVAKAGVICLGGQDAVDRLQAELESLCPGLSFTNAVVNWLDVSIEGWSKVEGVKALINTLRISVDEVCVFGDADNDLTMLSYIPNSCAMANANENAKAAARWHVGASADDGVAIALEQIAEAARLCNEQGREDILPAFMQA
ncbi:MAG: HAD family phosphatase [Atopobiaceae bacterium]|nr:HAD family phosphatase [Atopobiaceae bacterium]